jgi:virulence factor Mce-like protein
VTVLVTLVAVFLSYNANQGLPFVPTRELKVDIANGADLVQGNDVREGGFRIGLVSTMKPIELPNGQTGAEVTLKLNKANGNVPVDSTASVLPRSVLGLKYVDLVRGSSPKLIPDGGTLPISHTSVPVQFDDIFQMFDERTRSAIQQDLAGYGDALTARGSAINDTIASLPQLFQHLEPVARYLSDPSTQLTRFFDSLNAFMGTIAPVAQINAQLFTDMATTFEAISRSPQDLEATIRESPPTLDVSTTSLKVQQPFLSDFATFGKYMQPATAALVRALPVINPAIETGARTLKLTPSLNAGTENVLRALESLARAPGTNVALNGLTATTTTLNPMVRYLGPYQTVCDSWNYWWTYLSEHISEETSFGFSQRVLLNSSNPAPPQQNNVSQQGATQPANGGGVDNPFLGGNQYLHGPTYGAAVDNQGNADCEIGQRGYPRKLNHLDPRGRLLDIDNYTPGDQGPTFHGRAHVPAGETFTRKPSNQFVPGFGPVPHLPVIPSNQ